jgi:RND family efflux transporter MFP subunit
MRTFDTRQRIFARLMTIAALLAIIPAMVLADGGDDHSHDSATPKATASSGTSTTGTPGRRAERTVTTDGGQFRVGLWHSPIDPRVGEQVLVEVTVVERVEGGFGGPTGDVPIVGATVTLTPTLLSGAAAGKPVSVTASSESGNYSTTMRFDDRGDARLGVDVRTPDGRTIAADFPLTIVAAPVNSLFWYGLLAVLLGAAATVPAFRIIGRRDQALLRGSIRPIAASAALFLAGVVAVSLLVPMREQREPGGSVAAGPVSPIEAGSILSVSIPKQSQLLFGIRTVEAGERPVVAGIKAPGVVQSRPEAKGVVSPPVSGRLTLAGGIRVGASVGRGQSIGSIEQVLGASDQAQLEGQRVELRSRALEQRALATAQRSAASQARARLTVAERELTRAKALVEIGAAPKKRLDEAEAAVRIAELEVATAEAGARAADAQAVVAEKSIGSTGSSRTFPLTSPVGGIVTEVLATSGQQVDAGAELVRIVDLSSVYVEARVFEGHLEAIRGLSAATFTVSGQPDVVYRIGDGNGRLVSIGSIVDPATRTLPVVFEVPNPGNQLRDGQFIDVTIDTTDAIPALAIPRLAVVSDQGQTYVYVHTGGESFERRPITIGGEGQEYVAVTSGLKAGDAVVVEGLYQLRATKP